MSHGVISEQALRENEAVPPHLRGESRRYGADHCRRTLVRVNDAYCDLLGYSREELLAMTDPVHAPVELTAAGEGATGLLSGEISQIHRRNATGGAMGASLWEC
jgi:hypothetical protein